MSFHEHAEQEVRRLEPQWPGTLWWTFDGFANVLTGFAVRRSRDYPCAAPYPCGELDWQPGLLEPITLHPVRGRERVGERGYQNEEVCEYHWTVAAMTAEGLIAVLLFTMPDRTDKELVSRSAWRIAKGQFFVGQGDDESGVCPPGLLCGVVSGATPRWCAAHFDSGRIWCGRED